MNSLLRGLLWAGISVSLAACRDSASDISVVLPLEGRLAATSGASDYQAWYDPNLDITWMADAGVNTKQVWSEQVAWAQGLSFAGVSGWRLPSMDVNGDGIVIDCNDDGTDNCADNEYGYLYWIEGVTSENSGPFGNLKNWYYNSGSDPGEGLHPLCFLFSTGFNGSCVPETKFHAWAVHDGDVAVLRQAK